MHPWWNLSLLDMKALGRQIGPNAIRNIDLDELDKGHLQTPKINRLRARREVDRHLDRHRAAAAVERLDDLNHGTRANVLPPDLHNAPPRFGGRGHRCFLRRNQPITGIRLPYGSQTEKTYHAAYRKDSRILRHGACVYDPIPFLADITISQESILGI